jgi:CheY-like chemotaxis protein
MQSQTGRGLVLIVEDPLIQRFVGGILKRGGRLVVEADGDGALQILRAGETAVALLITNQPARFLDFAGTLPLLYFAAFPDPALADRFHRCRMLRKPFAPVDLMACAVELAPPEGPAGAPL